MPKKVRSPEPLIGSPTAPSSRIYKAISKQKNVEVSLCGEIAGDPHFLPLLIGLGFDALSASGTMLPDLKFFARRFSSVEARELEHRVEAMRRPAEIKECLKAFFDDRVSELVQ